VGVSLFYFVLLLCCSASFLLRPLVPVVVPVPVVAIGIAATAGCKWFFFFFVLFDVFGDARSESNSVLCDWCGAKRVGVLPAACRPTHSGDGVGTE
jgi:hypothetical protein